jgi:hypothetical protein
MHEWPSGNMEKIGGDRISSRIPLEGVKLFVHSPLKRIENETYVTNLMIISTHKR